MDTKDDVHLPRKLWEPKNPEKSACYKFMQYVNQKRDLKLETFQDLYDWSVGDQRLDFWEEFWKQGHIIHEGEYDQVLEPNVRMDHVPKWFSGVRLNFAENLLFCASRGLSNSITTKGKEDDKLAVTEVREGCTAIRHITWAELRSKVGLLSSAMATVGVKKGDRVAVVASHSIDTLVVFLAITSLGGLFSSSSTDMGVKGVLDRLFQIKPAWLFCDDAALYNGKHIDLREKMTAIAEAMKKAPEFQGTVSMPRWEQPLDVSAVPNCQTLKKFLRKARTDRLRFERVQFSDPFLVVYSSGTTGIPKCIVHSTGGVLLSANKEGRLHRDIGPDNVTLQYTTTGWIMYLSSILNLVHGARVVAYDGSPFLPNLSTFVKLVGEQRVTNLGISPRYMQTLATANISPRETTDLGALRAVTSTGMVLADPQFEWFYDKAFPPHVQLANISGGTDLAGCFGMENPLTPVYVGGCQGPSLGTPIDVFDSEQEGGPGVKGKAMPRGTPGELVATKAFPNMPVMFWGDEDGRKYFDAYFSRFDNVWTHGDFVQVHPVTGQIIFLGRADGVLNPSGVRFGSAEIYTVIESYFRNIVADSIVVGQRRPQDNDESVMLFLKMQEGEKFTSELVTKVKKAIAKECSPRHVPKYVYPVPAIPTTVNLKKVELPVKKIVSGQVVKPSGTLLNPESLDYYYQFAKVEDLISDSAKSKL